MAPEELRAIMDYVRERVRLAPEQPDHPSVVIFETPTEDRMIDAGLNAEGVRRLLRVPWWNEMVTDIMETPGFCEADDSPEQVLEYAKDVVSDYIRKRFPLDAG